MCSSGPRTFRPFRTQLKTPQHPVWVYRAQKVEDHIVVVGLWPLFDGIFLGGLCDSRPPVGQPPSGGCGSSQNKVGSLGDGSPSGESWNLYVYKYTHKFGS